MKSRFPKGNPCQNFQFFPNTSKNSNGGECRLTLQPTDLAVSFQCLGFSGVKTPQYPNQFSGVNPLNIALLIKLWLFYLKTCLKTWNSLEISMLLSSEKFYGHSRRYAWHSRIYGGDIAIIATSSRSRSLRVLRLRLLEFTWRWPGPELDNVKLIVNIIGSSCEAK